MRYWLAIPFSKNQGDAWVPLLWDLAKEPAVLSPKCAGSFSAGFVKGLGVKRRMV